MKSLLLLLSLGVITMLGIVNPAKASHDLIFSEYVEGSSNNKALEIYNTTGVVIVLDNYEIQIYNNGNAGPPNSTVALTGNLPGGSAYVITHTSAAAALLALADATANLSFNGDDALVLRLAGGGAIADVIGQVGFDPGSQWGAGDASTQNNTIRRKPTVCEGDIDPTDAYDPAPEWDGFAVDTFSGLGQHASTCGPVQTLDSSWGKVKSFYR